MMTQINRIPYYYVSNPFSTDNLPFCSLQVYSHKFLLIPMERFQHAIDELLIIVVVGDWMCVDRIKHTHTCRQAEVLQQ